MNASEIKICSVCKEGLPLSAFQYDRQKADKLRSLCKKCRAAKAKEYIQRWKEKRTSTPDPLTKKCSRCEDTKLIKDFVRDSCRPDGFHVWCNACRKPLNKKTRIKYKEKYRDRYKKAYTVKLHRSYGLDPFGYEKLAKQQSDKCAICGGLPSNGRDLFDVDHCHMTGKVRGLLCGNCNRGLGQFKDNPELCRKAATYLEK